MGRKLTRRVGVVAAALLVMALAACDTQPATDVTESAATLNAKGACTAGVSGTWEYQLRPVNSNVGWSRVGPARSFSCGQNTGEVALDAQRAEYLHSNTLYAYRVVSRLSNGTVQAWDANGTNGGGAYDTFTTGSYQAVDEYPPAEFVQPEGEDPVAYAAMGCKTKEIKNIRRMTKGVFKRVMFKLTLRTRWTYCSDNQIHKMYPASATCELTDDGQANGWICDDTPSKIRAVSTGGDPEHGAYTYLWNMVAKDPFRLIPYDTANWCATNQISGSYRVSDNHRRHGSCEIKPW
jgi:hypothetical protein